MKKIITLSLMICLAFLQSKAQTQPDVTSASFQKELKSMRPKLGIKAGYNFAKVIGSTPDFSPKSNNGFMVAGFFAPQSKGLGYRTELIFSRQGFSFDETGKMQDVTQDYIYMPHLTTFTIAKRVQLQAGGQVGYLLNAKKSSSKQSEEEKVTEYMNRFDYGFAGGIEIYPFKGLLIGGRYNVSLGNIYKASSSSSTTPSPIPNPLPFNPEEVKGKNAVVQFFVGYRF